MLYRHYVSRVSADVAKPLALVTTGDLEAFLGSAGWGPSARKSARTAVVSFWSWAARSGIVPDDVSARLPGVRVPRGRPRPTPESVLLTALRHSAARERLMLELGALAGLRAGEIARVRGSDYDGQTLLVHGKGGHQRLVPVEDGHLRNALSECGGWLFPSPRGGHLTPNHVSKLISRTLPDPWTAHTLRHRFGCRAYAATRDLLAVSALLGHASTDTTLTYVSLPDGHLRDAVRAAALRVA